MEPCATIDRALGQADTDTLQLLTDMQALKHAEPLARVLHVKAQAFVAYKKMVFTVSDEQLPSLRFCAFVGEFQAV